MLIALPNTDRSFTATLFLPRQGEMSFEQLRGRSRGAALLPARVCRCRGRMPDLASQFAAHPQSQLGTVYCAGWQRRRTACC